MRSFLRLLLSFSILISLLAISSVPAVKAATLPAEINKNFTPFAIIPGNISRLSVTIFNPNSFDLLNAAWSDNLIGVQPGIIIANPANMTTDCGGSAVVTAVPGTTSLALSGGTVGPQVGSTPGSCTVSIDVTSTTPGNLINTIPIGALTATDSIGDAISNTSPASATLQVSTVLPPSLNKNFNPATVWAGQFSLLTINIFNNDTATTLTQTTLTDTLPTNVIIYTPLFTNLSAGCGVTASVSAVAGGNSVTLNNGSIAPLATCSISVRVVSAVQGIYTNTIPAGPGGPGSIQTHQGVTNALPASAQLNVQQVNLTKTFTPATVAAGATSILTITLQNPTAIDYTGVNLTDNLPVAPSVMSIAAAPAPTNSCGGTLTATAGTGVIQLTGGTIPHSLTPPTVATCVITVPVTTPATAATGALPNVIHPADITTTQGITIPGNVTANLNIQADFTVLKSFNPTTITIGGTSTVTITLQNHTAAAFTGVHVVDTLPANLTVTGTPATTCGVPPGTLVNTTTTVTLNGGTIPASATPPNPAGTCTITFQVTSSVAATYTNTIHTVDATDDQGISPIADVSAPITVSGTTLPVGLTKAFQTNPMAAGATSRLRITITAPADTGLTRLRVTDVLPAGLLIAGMPLAPANPVTTCTPAGLLNAPVGGDTIQLGDPAALPSTGATLAAGAACTITVYVTTSTPGLYTNIIPASTVWTAEGRTNTTDVTQPLTVTGLQVSKAFYPNTIAPNGHSTLTITLTNTSPSWLINVSARDRLTTMGGNGTTTGVVISGTPNASTDCGGTITFPNTQTIQLTGGSIKPQVGIVPGTCVIHVDVRGLDTAGLPVTRTNTISRAQPDVTADVQGGATGTLPVASATAPLTITTLTINVVKGFSPLTVFGGSFSTLSVQLLNPNNSVLTGIAFADAMPAGMYIANPPSLNVGTCGGTLTGIPGSATFSFSGGTLAAATNCTLTLSVSMNVNGNLTNTILANSVTTFNGATNTQNADASLTNLPGVSVSKFFSPNPMVIGVNSSSLLTITIQNTGSASLVGLGLTDNLPGTLPAGLEIVGSPAPVNNCGGTLNAVAGTQVIQLTGGTIAGSASCTIEVYITGPTIGNYQNCIPIGAITDDQGISNTEPACDTLNIIGPDLTITKTNDVGGNLLLGNSFIWTLTTANIGTADSTFTNGQTIIRDPLPAGSTYGSPTPGGFTNITNSGNIICSIDGSNILTCTASGAPVTLGATTGSFTVTYGVTPTATGTLVNTATVDYDNDVTESNETNNTSTDTVTVTAPDLTVIKTDNVTGPLYVGNTFTWTLHVANSGRTASFSNGNVVLRDPLPIGATYANLTGPTPAVTGMTCAIDGLNVITCTAGVGGVTLAAGATFDVTVDVTPTAAGSMTNTATVDYGNNVIESNETNNTSTDSVTVIAYASLGDYVWNDVNANGLQEAGESGIPNVTVHLYDSSSTLIGTTSTDANGLYLFSNLTPGNYHVGFVAPAGYQFSPQDQGGNDAVDSDANTTSGLTAVTTLAVGETDLTWDAGLYQLASLGDFVWNDVNANGIQEAGENGIPNVTVHLYDSSSTLIGTTSTDANGLYLFSNLTPGNYHVGFVAPAGYQFSPQDQGGNDAVDSDANTTSGLTAVTTLVGGQTDLTWDAGLYQLASLGDFVWNDVNANGIQDTGESGIPNVTVHLYDSSSTLIGTTSTDANGLYLFSNLTPGNYHVGFVAPAGYQFSPQDQGGNDAVDSDANTTTGLTVVTTLVGGQTDLSWDAGLYQLASLGDYVWNDVNANGIQEAGESGIPNVTVHLYDSSSTLIGTTSTDANGLYLFSNLTPGNYHVGFVAPAGYQFSPQDQGSNDAVDSDADTTSGLTAVTTLVGGQTDLSWDAGLYRLASLGDFVWNDVNANGIQEAGESGIPNVTVHLYDSSSTLIGTTSTDANGLYLFSNLTPGDYHVGFVAPAGYQFSPQDQGGNDAVDSDANTTSGMTAVTTLVGGQTDLSWDAGLYRLASLGDFVWNDVNANGIQEAGENGIPNVTVHLYDSSSTLIGTTSTDANGLYLFSNLTPGNYHVGFVAPAGYQFSPQDQGGNDAVDSDANTTSGLTAVTTLVGGQTDLTWDAGLYQLASLGDYVWNDVNANGIQEAGESGIPNVTVHLYDSSSTLIGTTSTDANGLYLFSNLTPGNYHVGFVAPAGYQFSPQDQGGNDAVDSDANTTSGMTAVTTLAVGETDLTWDAGLYQLASLGDFVWNDVNANGIQEAGENGIPNVTVHLYDSSSTLIGTTSTDANGLYLFSNLTPGDYHVGFVAPAGYQFSPQDQGGNDAVDSDANTTSGLTAVTTLAVGETDLTWDAGLYRLASLGDFVWNDVNANGIQDTGESGIPNVTVHLYDSSNTLIGTTSTDANGLYLFSNLTPGNYHVGFVAPAGYQFSPQDQGGNDAVDSDANTTTGMTAVTTLAVGETDLTWDAGLYQPVSLMITKTDGVTSVNTGGSTTYTIRATNIGPSSVTGAILSDPAAAGLNKTAVACSATPGQCLTAPTVAQLEGGSFALPTMNAGQYYEIKVTAIVTATSGSVTNTATVTPPPGTTDMTSGDNTDSDTDALTAIADLEVTKTDGVSSVVSGETLTYTVRATNKGPSSVTGAILSDIAAVGLTKTAVACSATPGQCVTAPTVQELESSSFALPPLNNGQYYEITVTAIVTATSGSVTNMATVVPPSGITDPTPNDNSDTDADVMTLPPPAVIPNTGFAPGRVSILPQQPEALTYAKMGDFWVEIPSLGVQITIVGVPQTAGKWDVSWLGRQAGWLNGTAYPGSTGNSVITGHVYLPNGKAGPFVNLRTLKWGDRVIIHSPDGQMYIYEVREVERVLPNDTTVFRHEERSWITLVTCQGYNEADNTYSYRTVVRAVLISVKPDPAKNPQ